MAHRIAELINAVPKNTIEVKKELADFIPADLDSVNRWYNNPEIKIQAEKLMRAHEYFKQYWPKLLFEDLFNDESIISTEALH
jgi:hypothetical protein